MSSVSGDDPRLTIDLGVRMFAGATAVEIRTDRVVLSTTLDFPWRDLFDALTGVGMPRKALRQRLLEAGASADRLDVVLDELIARGVVIRECLAPASRAYHRASCLGRFIEYGIVVPTAPPRAPAEPLDRPMASLSMDLVDVLRRRASQRSFGGGPLPMDTLLTLLWAAYGTVSFEHGQPRRTVPSAGGLHALTLFVLARRIEGLQASIARFDPDRGTLAPEPFTLEHELGELFATHHVDYAGVAAVIVYTVDRAPVEARYGERGYRYALLEVGHAAQNLLLAATAVGVLQVPVGSFDDDLLNRMLRLPSSCVALYAVVLGMP